MNKKQVEGKTGETIASDYLDGIGYRLLHKNFRCKQGEIDLIAKDGEDIVFIEVKTRRSTNYGEAREAVNREKIRHIMKTAMYYLYMTRQETAFVRIDVIEVYLMHGEVRINHLKQVI
ncbi:MAG: YraN family protein [Clostridia bacterium]|nr:YraN family protein [Clostridia bacterium]